MAERRRVLVAYDSVEGQSQAIAERLGVLLGEGGVEATVVPVAEAPTPGEDFGGVILGGSVHAGRHGKALERYAAEHAEALNALPSGFFSVSLTAVKTDEKHHQIVADLAETFTRHAGWEPDIVGLFGGALKYREYGFLKRQLMKQISKKEGGPTDTSRDWDLTDWENVEAFAADFVAVMRSR